METHPLNQSGNRKTHELGVEQEVEEEEEVVEEEEEEEEEGGG